MERSKVLETMLAFVIMLGIIYWYTKNPWLLLAALVLAMAGLLFKSLAEKIALLWLKLSHAIGSVINNVILTVVFIFILIPLSFLSKAFKKRTNTRGGSYFNTRNTTYTKKDLENIW
ncbi:hypothetical protein [Niastella populi]|uniref:SxtJ n=1 Tax=Niastella populi TaxID=550983 RepID=A0A1V9FCL3_9BACT|nr:hypothetical protein [Niastella populi]OQP56114.1 hypothetical protein A4R26_26735 [Niastella populi]